MNHVRLISNYKVFFFSFRLAYIIKFGFGLFSLDFLIGFAKMRYCNTNINYTQNFYYIINVDSFLSLD